MTTNIMPSLTLGPGGIGGAITGDNVTVHHLYNIKRIAYETSRPPEEAFQPSTVPAGPVYGPSPDELEVIVREVAKEVLKA